nr:hypothetical protein HmN_000982100 [Hymenolepis microstoma]
MQSCLKVSSCSGSQEEEANVSFMVFVEIGRDVSGVSNDDHVMTLNPLPPVEEAVSLESQIPFVNALIGNLGPFNLSPTANQDGKSGKRIVICDLCIWYRLDRKEYDFVADNPVCGFVYGLVFLFLRAPFYAHFRQTCRVGNRTTPSIYFLRPSTDWFQKVIGL